MQLDPNRKRIFLPKGTAQVSVKPIDQTSVNSSISLFLGQWNCDALSSLKLSQSRDSQTVYILSDTEAAARTFMPGADDGVPLLLRFFNENDVEEYSPCPGTSIEYSWDGGARTFLMTPPSPGQFVANVPVPPVRAGQHTITIYATPHQSAKTYSASIKVNTYSQALYIDADGQFSESNPQDDLPNFVPGSDLNGSSVAITPSAAQRLTLHVTAPATGTATLELIDVSSYPGIAMNYPVQNPGSEPDVDFAPGQQSVTLTIPQSKWVSQPLYVRDYAANAKIRVTVPLAKGGSYTYTVSLPRDRNGDKIADSGWQAGTTHVADSASGAGAPEADLDPTPAGPTQLGDGFSAFEEYRGFIVHGQHQRLDPQVRDLFIDSDLGIDHSFIDAHLPYRLHYIGPGESSGTDLNRGQTPIPRTAPVIDTNRSNVLGAQVDGQRGLRIVFTSKDYPGYFDTDGLKYPVWQFGIRGNTWQDQMTIDDLIPSQAAYFVTLNPNHIRFVEIFERSGSNAMIHMGGGANQNPTPVYVDENGLAVPDCLDPNTPPATPCDQYLPWRGVVAFQQFSSQRFVLHSRLTFPGDYYTKDSFSVCGGTVLQEVTQSAFAFLASVVVGHEIGHNLALDHTTYCGDVMYGDGGLMPNYLPYPTDYNAAERNGMRTHQ